MPLFEQLYNFAHWLSKNREEAEDLVQETYAKALKGFGSFRPGTNFRAWIYRILRNTFLNTQAGLKAGTFVSFDNDDDQLTEPAAAETPESVLLARVNLETMDADGNTLPSAGVLSAYEAPSGPGVRPKRIGGATPR